MRTSLLIFMIITGSYSLRAQDPVYSLYNNNLFWHNSAYTGAEDKKNIILSFRNQGQSKDVNATTYCLSYDQPIKRSGIGIILFQEKVEFKTVKQIGLNYNYKIKFSEKANLRIGTQISIMSVDIDAQKIKELIPNMYLSKDIISMTTYDIDLGILFSWSEFYLGLSSKQIPYQDLRYIRDPDFNLQLPRNNYIVSGYKFKLNEKFELEPSFIYRDLPPQVYKIAYNKLYKLGDPDYFEYKRNGNSNTVFDFNTSLIYKNQYRVGLSYRGFDKSLNHIILNFGYTFVSKVQIDAAYTLPNSVLGYSVEGVVKVFFK